MVFVIGYKILPMQILPKKLPFILTPMAAPKIFLIPYHMVKHCILIQFQHLLATATPSSDGQIHLAIFIMVFPVVIRLRFMPNGRKAANSFNNSPF